MLELLTPNQQSELQQSIKNMAEWCQDHDLLISASKTNVPTFLNSKDSVINPTLTINSTNIETVTTNPSAPAELKTQVHQQHQPGHKEHLEKATHHKQAKTFKSILPSQPKLLQNIYQLLSSLPYDCNVPSYD